MRPDLPRIRPATADLAVREPFHIVHQKHRPIPRRQILDRRRQLELEIRVRLSRRRGDRIGMLQIDFPGPDPLHLPLPVVDHRNRDRGDPGRERRLAPKSGQAVEGPDERVLGIVRRQIPVPDHAVDEPVHPIHVRVIQFALGILVTRQDAGDETRRFHPAPGSRGALYWQMGQWSARKGCIGVTSADLRPLSE
jgi:hypothetical protein